MAHVWAGQERLLDKVGQRMPVEDSYIAATPRRHGLTIATGNDRDFKRPGLKVSMPSKSSRSGGACGWREGAGLAAATSTLTGGWYLHVTFKEARTIRSKQTFRVLLLPAGTPKEISYPGKKPEIRV